MREEGLEGEMVFVFPIGVDCDRRNGYGTGEVRAGHRSDSVLFHWHVELTFVQHIVTSIIGRHREVDGSLRVVQKRVEVKLFFTISDVEYQRLAAVDTAQTGGGIEGA